MPALEQKTVRSLSSQLTTLGLAASFSSVKMMPSVYKDEAITSWLHCGFRLSREGGLQREQ